MAEFWQSPDPQPPGKVHLVGGAVRDHLLGLPVGERDWVVTGARPEDMSARGYKPVGRDFPVFLHPETGEEYALARTERKSGRGYHGFVFNADPDVSLEDDLARRDLSVNAMAMDTGGTLIDPHGGRADLEARTLRHVASAFTEDPLRVLRVARFAARFAPLDFTVADETQELLASMVAGGELDALTPERVWQETTRALMSERPAEYFRLLREIGALKILFPELDAQFGVPQPPRYHPEIDCGLHTLMALDQAARAGAGLDVRIAVLCHDYGKGETPAEVLPGHRGHERRGLPLVEAMCARYRVSKDATALAALVTEYHLLCHQAQQLRPETLLKLIERLDALRRPERLEQFVQACEADARGRTGLEDQPYPQAEYLRDALRAAREVDITTLRAAGHQGAELGAAIRRARVQALTAWKATRA